MPKAIKCLHGKQRLEEGKEKTFIEVDDRIPSLHLPFSASSVGLSVLCHKNLSARKTKIRCCNTHSIAPIEYKEVLFNFEVFIDAAQT